ncbi:AraC family transcriptional regulator [Variovorax sp. J22R133]|uniref:AraC family transcriptional regulator n=1 Tax=Variovorax brevis TaxID=3053503 RepID=UPI00257874CE|nr:AraC family transcriptional regulator [Variovorax sp. J22R133]MDM0116981.1 AraC family transcriptional regulator [Variovorax sp. J22R133]
MAPLVRAAALTNFMEVAESLGFNPREALRHAGLNHNLLKDPEQRISTDAVVALLEESATGSGCDTFGLRMAESRQLSSFGVVSLLITHQATLRDALITTIDYRHLLNESLAMQLEDAGRMAILRQEVLTTKPSRQGAELALGVVFRMCSALMGAQWRPSSVNFTHSAPSDLRLHRRVFACRLEFDSEFNGIVFAAADLAAPNPRADPAMARYARQFIESLPQSHEDAIVLEVRRAIYLMLPTGRATSESVAQGLGMSVRSMQRQLDEAGATFTTLLNAVRCELAPRYMENPKFSLSRISEMLGYSTQGSFTRWFAAQFGELPSTWREREEARQHSRDQGQREGPKPSTGKTGI